jgi:putative two-component system response regulator
VADVYDALTSERVYKDAIEKEKAYYMIINGECGVFSPKLLECFRNAREEFEAMSDALQKKSE